MRQFADQSGFTVTGKRLTQPPGRSSFFLGEHLHQPRSAVLIMGGFNFETHKG
jgi:hypothetical protein